MGEVAILIPTLGRADRLLPLLGNIAAVTPPHAYQVVFILDQADDESRQRCAQMLSNFRGKGMEGKVGVLLCDGTYPEKINAGVAATTEPWVLLTADDVVFHPGWWEATEQLRDVGQVEVRRGDQAPGDGTEHGVGVIGTNDLHNPATAKGKYATQILVARWYIDAGLATADTQPGKAFHEGYHHEQIDRELCHVAQARGLYAHAAESVIEHLHFATGQRPRDATDEKGNRAARQADKALYEARRHLWEG